MSERIVFSCFFAKRVKISHFLSRCSQTAKLLIWLLKYRFSNKRGVKIPEFYNDFILLYKLEKC